MAQATLTISSKNYSSWSLRGWLLCKMAGLDFAEEVLPSDDPSTRAELLLLSPSFLVPRLRHDGVTVWDTLAIAEYLDELKPEVRLLPTERAARAHCRAISGEMHSGFSNLRSALPMNLKAHYAGFKVWAGAQADIDRHRDLARVPLGISRPLPVRRCVDGRCHVRAGVHAVPDLRRETRSPVRGVLPADHGVAA